MIKERRPMAYLPRLKVLADEALDRIHDASIQLLEKTGVVFECEESVNVFKNNAVKVDGLKVFVPGKLAETAVEKHVADQPPPLAREQNERAGASAEPSESHRVEAHQATDSR